MATMTKKAKATANGTATEATKQEIGAQLVTIKPPNMKVAKFNLIGTELLVINKMSARAKAAMMATQAEGSTATGRKKREPKDFDKLFKEAAHVSREGWYGVHAGCFRNAMISACRLIGLHMTKMKLSVFVEADGYDNEDGQPLVRIHAPNPKRLDMHARNDNGSIDIRSRPVWEPGWRIELRIRWDADQYTLADIANLLSRVGAQVGIGEGRPDSKNSNGMGWGLFDVEAAK